MKFKHHILINVFLIFCFFTLIRATQCQTRWEKRVGLSSRKEACDNINIDYDNGYLLSATIYPSSGLGSGLFIKTDINGNILWEKVITDNTRVFAIKNAISNQNSGYIIAGYYGSAEILGGEGGFSLS